MRLLSLQAHNFLAGFNPRICKRCDLVIHPQVIVSFGFNPRICKRCDVKGSNAPHSTCVSIHASVKDATLDRKSHNKDLAVSIHASVKDATSNALGFFNTFLFQSTHL